MSCDQEASTQTSDYLSHYLTTNSYQICRFCFEKSTKLVPIFDSHKPPHFSMLIMACASVQVAENDDLPQQLCTKCISKLNIAFQLKTQCEMADAKFRQALENMQRIQQLRSNDNQAIEEAQTLQTIECDTDLEAGIKLDIMQYQTEIISSEFDAFQSNEECAMSMAESMRSEQLVPENYVELSSTISDQAQAIETNRNAEKIDETRTSNSKRRKASSKDHSCHICKKAFRTKPSLVHHIRIHTGERPYVCHLCDKRFINGGHLHTHMKTHTGEKNHACGACLKAFTTAQQLTKHTIAIHTGERPHGCPYCAKRFASSSNLGTHVKIHTGEKNYYCDQCGKAFITKGQLSQHMLVHTGEKAFMCEFCQKRFTQKAHLARHLKMHSNETGDSRTKC